jgi:RimJ/RimL family protein N-acetyltransferase
VTTTVAATVPADDWFALPVLTGSVVRLEPMTAEHADGYLAALSHGGDEVFAHLNLHPPTTLDQARAQVHAALGARARAQRFPYAQIDTATGEFAGTTSLYDIDPGLRTVAIGHTWLGRRWWRSGVNTESKLLLLTDAFERLGAARLVWHTDIHNERSQAAIARLGATREGELRKHRIRKDGSWRTTVQYSMTDDDWPVARERLRARLAAG